MCWKKPGVYHYRFPEGKLITMGVNTSGLACCDEIEDKQRMNRKNKARARNANQKTEASADYEEDWHALQGKTRKQKNSPRIAHYLSSQQTAGGNKDIYSGLCCPSILEDILRAEFSQNLIAHCDIQLKLRREKKVKPVVLRGKRTRRSGEHHKTSII